MGFNMTFSVLDAARTCLGSYHTSWWPPKIRSWCCPCKGPRSSPVTKNNPPLASLCIGSLQVQRYLAWHLRAARDALPMLGARFPTASRPYSL